MVVKHVCHPVHRYRGESGHVFQGRYKAILIGGGRSLLGLVDYIHLNPVRAGLCDLAGLRGYELSSYPKYWKREVRAELERGKFLSILGASNGGRECDATKTVWI